MDLAEYKKRFCGRDDISPGWDAIDSRLRQVYGDQEPQHWGSVLKYMIGGPDPLDGISAYECRDGGTPHLHFCTYGYSSIRRDYPTDLVGLAFVLDPTLAPIDTPHGRVEFIQAFGISSRELESIRSERVPREQAIEAHRSTNPLMITDLDRKDATAP